ncbi:unnamed protein product [Lactuca saligna]|uniref:Uncharacterized protein n=1 Tax=Lactuca saligna TaxID=75948 RepID=A0AA35YXI5_LACSI|nr:unnamed protein product [Lactuca saligna]
MEVAAGADSCGMERDRKRVAGGRNRSYGPVGGEEKSNPMENRVQEIIKQQMLSVAKAVPPPPSFSYCRRWVVSLVVGLPLTHTNTAQLHPKQGIEFTMIVKYCLFGILH